MKRSTNLLIMSVLIAMAYTLLARSSPGSDIGSFISEVEAAQASQGTFKITLSISGAASTATVTELRLSSGQTEPRSEALVEIKQPSNLQLLTYEENGRVFAFLSKTNQIVELTGPINALHDSLQAARTGTRVFAGEGVATFYRYSSSARLRQVPSSTASGELAELHLQLDVNKLAQLGILGPDVSSSEIDFYFDAQRNLKRINLVQDGLSYRTDVRVDSTDPKVVAGAWISVPNDARKNFSKPLTVAVREEVAALED